MDLKKFNDSFPSWQKQFEDEKNIIKLLNDEKEKKNISKKFLEQFPQLTFADLKKQNSKCRTNDGCIHYMHMKNTHIYSWNFIANEWNKKEASDPQSLLKLFV